MKTIDPMPEHFRELPKGHCVFLLPSNVQAMITGVERIQQNQKGLITLTYQGGSKRTVQMGDLNLAKQTDFMETFRAIWKRIEFGI